MAKQKDSEEKVEVPDYLSPEWHDYVMGHFEPHELIDGNPVVAGLRRVAELLLGDIISSKPIDVFPVAGDKHGRATVVYEVQFRWKIKPLQQHPPSDIRTYADVADVWHGNTDDLFYAHSPATASTRAEGRALRKALKIRALAAEELTKKDPSKIIADDSHGGDNERIAIEQYNYIVNKCKALDIDIIKFINSGGRTYRSIYEVSRETGVKMTQSLQKMLRGEVKVSDSIKGFNENWGEE